jgi:hypothetical protein
MKRMVQVRSTQIVRDFNLLMFEISESPFISKSWGSGRTRTTPDRGLQGSLSRKIGSDRKTETDSCVCRSSLSAVVRRRDTWYCDVEQGARDTS